VNTAEIWIAGIVGLAAAVEDLLRRQVSNWIAGAAFAGGVICHLVTGGWSGLLTALLGAASGFGVFLIFYWLGGMGGGDVKLMAGFGALLGSSRLFEAALWTAGLGGLMAAGVIAWGVVRNWLRRRQGSEATREAATIPYAPAITLGVWLALIPK
jgi:prepilin peptidase CpaA